jgi:hypothetical protein
MVAEIIYTNLRNKKTGHNFDCLDLQDHDIIQEMSMSSGMHDTIYFTNFYRMTHKVYSWNPQRITNNLEIVEAISKWA